MPGDEKFLRKERLTRKREFEAVYATGRKYVGRAFICYVARREGQGRKFGFAVSRRVGAAVVRNRVKRLLREFYRRHRRFLAEDVQLVVVARPASGTLRYEQCAEAMRQLLAGGEVLRG